MNRVDVYYSEIKNEPIKNYEAYLEFLPDSIINRNVKFVRWQDRQANILGKFLLIRWLKNNKYDANVLKEIEFTKYGRPFLPIDIEFNISHSGSYVLCAISKGVRLGVDIEEKKDIDINSFKSVFTEDEFKHIVESSNSIDSFYRLWSVKESVIKADGRGLSIPLKEIHFFLNKNTAVIEEKKWFLKELHFNKNYRSYLATNLQKITINLNKIQFYN